ncbi:AAA family ATPase [Actinoplanes sp. Pm04-4]|uniref:AAA family ATPase n=1 Tax=Paractinoplanes pyxinae TaxID=2997416 RepID=A0ABT4BGG2_9ACTN|nr:AAA family ATPase [Actinoplanes pyxinae]MCY1145625.1 AAA family ATPase [Actinoplanes pyxinae]
MDGNGLLGRRHESKTLVSLVNTVRGGDSQVLVLRGEAGIGKTALLDHLTAVASGFRVARASGVESEMELPFAALHQLCGPHLDRLDALPQRQQAALGTAFRLRSGSPPDPFVVGLATLTLLSQVADEQPLICVIDDAQWLDQASAQALEFVARRLAAEPVGLVLAVRDELLFDGLPGLGVRGLSDDDAAALLDSAAPGGLDPRVRERILAECRGNPLALLELPRGLSRAELAFGGATDTEATPLVHRLEREFVRQIRTFPSRTRRLLLIAAAEPVGDAELLWLAAARLGIGAEAAADAEQTGLVSFRDRVRFRHPLVRSAVYRSAGLAERREAHRALAESTDPRGDADRRAWHRARAAVGPDEDVAAELERCADRAATHGGIAAAAAFLDQAAALTPDPARRVRRSLDAAQAKAHAGAFPDALAVLAMAESGRLSPEDQARVELLRAQISFTSGRGNVALPLLLAAARRLEPLDPRLARDTYLDAMSAALFAGRFAAGTRARQVAEAVQAANTQLHHTADPDRTTASHARESTPNQQIVAAQTAADARRITDTHARAAASNQQIAAAQRAADAHIHRPADTPRTIDTDVREATGNRQVAEAQGVAGTHIHHTTEAAQPANTPTHQATPTRESTINRQIAEAQRAAETIRAGQSHGSRKNDALLDGLATLFTDGYPPAATALHKAVHAFATEELTMEEALRSAWLSIATASALWNDADWDAITRRHLNFARSSGALSALPLALDTRIVVQLFTGDLTTAAALVEERRSVAEATRSGLAPYGEIGLWAVRGRADRAEPMIRACLEDVTARGEGVGVNMTQWARAVLCNGLGRYPEAVAAAREAAADPLELGLPQWALAELIEAAVHSGDQSTAATALEQLSPMARASGTDWALGVEASRRALLHKDADALHREAIERLDRTLVGFEAARARLLYGEWLRREGRRVDARTQLREAHEAFVRMGADAFAGRTGRELQATGETIRRRTVEAPGKLTAQEAHIARLAAEGLTNPEIGAALYISPRTVEWHLRRIYSKLGVGNRRRLRQTLNAG